MSPSLRKLSCRSAQKVHPPTVILAAAHIYLTVVVFSLHFGKGKLLFICADIIVQLINKHGKPTSYRHLIRRASSMRCLSSAYNQLNLWSVIPGFGFFNQTWGTIFRLMRELASIKPQSAFIEYRIQLSNTSPNSMKWHVHGLNSLYLDCQLSFITTGHCGMWVELMVNCC